MSNSWDKYFSHYSDWDDAHCFNVRLELKFEDEIKNLGYVEYVNSNDIFTLENEISSALFRQISASACPKGVASQSHTT